MANEKPSSVKGELLFFGVAIAAVGGLIFLLTMDGRHEPDANYLVVDSGRARVDATVKIDGVVASNENPLAINKLEGSERHPVLVEVASGTHSVEVVVAGGAPEVFTLEVPQRGMRAVYSVAPSRWVLATVAYGEEADLPPVLELEQSTPKLSLLPDTKDVLVRKLDLSTINRAFPSIVHTKQDGATLRSLCTVREDDTHDCSFDAE